jgi:hypothetical protein
LDSAPACFGVERLGGHVEAAGPRNCSRLRVDLDPGERSRIVERLEDAAPLATGEVNLPDRAVLEREPETVLTDDLDARDVYQLVHA